MSNTISTYVDQLLSFGRLSAVPAEQLEWLVEQSSAREFSDGEFVGKEGTKIDGPHFVLEGKIGVYLHQVDVKRDISTLTKGDIFGYLPYSRSSVASLNAQAQGPVRILSFPTDRIREMINTQFELTQALVHVMSTRVRDYTTLQQQTDKMAALGKLAAGLAHELNNPASALVSDSLSLRQHLRLEPLAFKELTAIHLEPYQVEGANEELLRIMSGYQPSNLSLKERTKKEELIADWLDENEISDSEEMAEIFADFNIGTESLEVFKKFVPANARKPVFSWILNVLVTEKMVLDIQLSASRISELIKSVKIYTHMDRGSEKISANIHEGIRNTISILGHKFRRGNVSLIERYDESLPPVKVYPGELNQVWTNLIDNALDAMEANKKGMMTITTERDREFVKVTINDDGPGIPESIISNVFDPFFTTKELGKGTGMGLETVRRIVLKHKGSVKVSSTPGDTTFTVCFLIDSDVSEEK
ncbi:ATP-binding protein [Desertivirga xinjiangensis]|uniref:ATP-binding protein n=1 Tax=Desertivirga xinjiangensis TaxID=539206 RepID=UPI00210C978E|nr:ATP-binding protein [Pedobacter xinjiangensis]